MTTLLVFPNAIRRLTAVLFAGQSIASVGTTGVITIGSIAITQMFAGTALAGVPATLFTIGTALGAYPAGRLMNRYGRRWGLVLGFAVGILGAVTGTVSLVAALPLLLLLSYFGFGLARGAVDQGRFAAGDMVSEDRRARAIGWVVLGGTVGGIGGPLLIGPSGDWSAQLSLDPLAGPFLVATVMFVLGGLVTFALLRPDPSELGRHLSKEASSGDGTPARSLSQALTSRNVQTAIAAMVLGQVVMTTVMTMTPLQMTEHLHHTLYDVSLVIAAHVTGMYGISVVTGRVADRLGHAKTILIGALLLISACLVAPFAAETLRLALALFVLGAGWNFCFVAGSSLLTDSLLPKERPRIQGTNDLLVGLVAATGSLTSGLAFDTVGYLGIALAGISLAIGLFLYVLTRVREVQAVTL